MAIKPATLKVNISLDDFDFRELRRMFQTYRPVGLNRVAGNIKAWRIRKGFSMPETFDDVDLLLSKLALVHSEVSEATEAVRHGDAANFAEELADAVIRILDISASLGIDLEQAIEDKMEKNEGRPYMHGKRA